MDSNTLVEGFIEAGAEFVDRLDRRIPVEVAFWMKPAEDGRWSLHIVSKQITSSNRRQGYAEVSRVVSEMQDHYLDQFRVKLIPIDDPLARAAIEARRRYPAKLSVHHDDTSLGNIGIDGAYFYSLVRPAHV